MKNQEKVSNKSHNIQKKFKIKTEESDNLNRNSYKKTLRILILDPPEEGIDDPEYEHIAQKPEELSKSLIFNKSNITSKSSAFDKIKKKIIQK